MNGIEPLHRCAPTGHDTVRVRHSEGSAQMRELAEAAGALFLIAKPLFSSESFARGPRSGPGLRTCRAWSRLTELRTPRTSGTCSRSCSAATPTCMAGCPSTHPGPQSSRLTMEAVYVDDQLGHCGPSPSTDLPFAGHAGASVGLVPRGGAEACDRARRAAQPTWSRTSPRSSTSWPRCSTGTGGSRTSARRLLPARGAGCPPTLTPTAAYIDRNDLDISISGYGDGQMGLIIA